MEKYEEMTAEELEEVYKFYYGDNEEHERSDIPEPKLYLSKEEHEYEYEQIDSNIIRYTEKKRNRITNDDNCLLLKKNEEILHGVSDREENFKNAVNYLRQCSFQFGLTGYNNDILFQEIKWMLNVLYTNKHHKDITNSFRYESVVLATIVIGLIECKKINIQGLDKKRDYSKVSDKLEELDINLYKFIKKSFKPKVQTKMINDTNTVYLKTLMKRKSELEEEDIWPIVVPY